MTENVASPEVAASLVPRLPAIADVALRSAPFGISLTSARPESFGKYVFANDAYCRISGYSLAELETLTFREIVHPHDLPSALEGLERLMSGAVAEIDTELRLLRRAGSSIVVRQHRTITRDKAGAPLLIVSHTEDVSERKDSEAASAAERAIAEHALRDSEERYRLLAEHSADMIVCTRPDRTRFYVSPASYGLLGFTPAEMMDLDFQSSIHPDDRESVIAAHETFLTRGGTQTLTYRMVHKDGRIVWVEASWVFTCGDSNARVNDSSVNAILSVVRDISERKSAEEKIESMACHDALTGLPNRVLLRERLEEGRLLVERGGSMAVLSIDLDSFKSVNDTHGHATGDALLQGVAARLLRCVRETDTVARLGGDEFVIVLVGLRSREEAAQRGRTIVAALSEPYDLNGQRLLASASVGITTSPRDGIAPDQLLKNADVALYAAKAEGGSGYRSFEPSLAVHRQARLDTEAELRLALAAESFVVYYQPIVSLESTAIIGFEALLRWQHPVRGLIFPDAFIPIAEDTGMIVPLGEWVLRRSCRDAVMWPPAIRLAVNVSSIQLRSATFVETVRSALRESGLHPGRLDLEITESVLLQECDGTLEVLNALRRLGVGISLDDFGTGHSSLGYLRSFRFDRIKIDRSFVGDLLQRAESEAIVRAVVGIGNALGIATVAEGVETRSQLQRLRSHGCTEAQGFLFSKARPVEEITAMLAAFPVESDAATA